MWERDLFFRVLPLLVMKSVAPLQRASLLRLLPTSGQLADEGALSRSDCPAQHCSVRTEVQKQLNATLPTVDRRGRTAQFCPHLLILFFFLYSRLLLESES